MNPWASLQLDIMVALIGVCAVVSLFAAITKAIPKSKKIALILLEVSVALLLLFDRFAYIYRGNESTVGYWMVRISNFAVFLFTIVVLFAFNLYLIDLFKEKWKKNVVPIRLRVVKWLALVGVLLLIVSQFTGIYYTFDDANRYVRAPGFIVCYLFPISILLLQLTVIIQYRKILSGRLQKALLVFSVAPLIAAIVQVFVYGLSLINISMGITAVTLYIFAIFDINITMQEARERETEYLKERKHHMDVLLDQTAQVLASAIDAKDKYTRGHSTRVAQYSKEIASLSGKSEQECEEIYYAALVHDVGKIGISDTVINKKGRLTDEEYEEMKKHPVIGKEILASINLSPFLQDGAYCHHERYDGKGYPEGKKGTEIPELGRIIAVADAYDAMTSKRSYRDPLPQDKVRAEIANGIGTQFDPTFAEIMLRLIDADSNYDMREKI